MDNCRLKAKSGYTWLSPSKPRLSINAFDLASRNERYAVRESALRIRRRLRAESSGPAPTLSRASFVLQNLQSWDHSKIRHGKPLAPPQSLVKTPVPATAIRSISSRIRSELVKKASSTREAQ